ncbi:MAG: RlmE family RNA methyltransferase [Maricaulaceae bacterium]
MSKAGDGQGGDERRRRRKKSGGPQEPGRGEGLTKRVKTARGRKLSSTLWLKRQLNDPYVERAKAAGYRSRAAFKLIGLDDKFRLLKKDARVVDLGTAPGGWIQVALERGASKVVGVDLLSMEPITGAELIEGDFTEPEIVERVRAAIDGRADLVLSDMAANTTGHRATDHLRVVALVEAAADFAEEVLAPGGAFVAKVFQGGAEGDLLARLKTSFEKVRHAKPPASRPESPETYLVATGFRGRSSG